MVTLKPQQIDAYGPNMMCLLCSWDTVDVLANVLLFVPLGMALIFHGVGNRWGLMISASLSLAVEVVQLWIPGRVSGLTDVAANTLGAAVGIAAARSWLGDVLRSTASLAIIAPAPQLASRLTLGLSVVTSVVLILPGLLLRPSFPKTTYFVGTRTLENIETPLRIGGDTIYGEHMHGVIDEVRIYNGARTIDEIRRDMKTLVWGTPPSVDLVAAYGFEEGTGITVYDASGHSNTGTISGATWTDQGRFGRALMFDGLKSMVSIAPSPVLNLAKGMTLSAWVYPMPGLRGWRQVLKKEIDTYFLTVSSDVGSMRPAGGGAFWSMPEGVKAPMPIAANTWVYLALTYDGSTFCLYVNGNQVVCQTHWYPGDVFRASVGDLRLTPGSVFDSSRLRIGLLEGEPLRVYGQAAPDPVAHPLLFLRVSDKSHEDILFLGADHEDLRLRVRTRAMTAGFNSPDIIFRGVMRDLPPGKPFTVTLWPDDNHWCADVNDTITCTSGFTIGTGWTLFCASQYLPVGLQTVLNWFWVAAIVWPIGFWARSCVETTVAGGLLVMSIWVLPGVTGLAPTPPVEIGAMVVGFLMGAALRLIRSRTSPEICNVGESWEGVT
jgi:VanZ like family/Concanavalin A-like lectin/glucanases superfamily